MRTLPEWLVSVCRWILVVGLPITLTLTNVRLLMTPAFPEIEYNLSDFPADFYGFTKEDRLYWAKRSIGYILGDPRVGPVEAWKFSDGGRAPAGTTAPPGTETCSFYGGDYGPRDCTFFYNDREVRHMVDVRNVVSAALIVWAVSGLLVLAALAALAYFRQTAALRWGVITGASVTWAVFLFVVAFVVVGFQQFFTFFHRVFFVGDTWIFLWSDSLIRLFPLKFWFDAFLFVGLATLAQAALAAVIAWRGIK